MCNQLHWQINKLEFGNSVRHPLRSRSAYNASSKPQDFPGKGKFAFDHPNSDNVCSQIFYMDVSLLKCFFFFFLRNANERICYGSRKGIIKLLYNDSRAASFWLIFRKHFPESFILHVLNYHSSETEPSMPFISRF